MTPPRTDRSRRDPTLAADDPRLPGAARTLALLARSLERATAELTLAQYRILALVAAGDERAGRLATRLAVAKPTVTAVVDGLVERGLLRREPVPGDRRASRLVVTSSGRGAVDAAEAAMADRLATLFAEVGDPEALLAGLAEVGRALTSRIDHRLERAEATGADVAAPRP